MISSKRIQFILQEKLIPLLRETDSFSIVFEGQPHLIDKQTIRYWIAKDDINRKSFVMTISNEVWKKVKNRA